AIKCLTETPSRRESRSFAIVKLMNNFDNQNCKKVSRFPKVANYRLTSRLSRHYWHGYTGIMTAPASHPSLKSLKADHEALLLEWSDGMVHRIPWRRLRDLCPCATCRQKRSEPAPVFNILKPEEAGPVRATSMSPIGNYAYQIEFSDGHKTGIYSL